MFGTQTDDPVTELGTSPSLNTLLCRKRAVLGVGLIVAQMWCAKPMEGILSKIRNKILLM